MKKKLIVFLMAATMIFAFAGCGSQQEEAAEEPVNSTLEVPAMRFRRN